ncbi:MAG: HNH endonuclease signature motif containing protein [Beutenbergiaceae bacterium]
MGRRRRLEGDPVLDRLSAADAAVAAAEVERLLAVVAWVLAHPPSSGAEAATFIVAGNTVQHGPQRSPLNEPEVPQVAVWAVAELAATLGISTESGRRLVSESLELAFRLPRIWDKVRSGHMLGWRARQIARSTYALPGPAAEFVDQHLATVDGVIRRSQIENVVTEAITRYDQERFLREGSAKRELRHCEIALSGTTLGGITPVSGHLDLVDALDLDAALRHAADRRADAGDASVLGVRRARALGDIARNYLQCSGLPLVGGGLIGIDTDPQAARPVTIVTPPEQPSAALEQGASAPRSPHRQVMVYLHLSEPSIAGAHPLGRVGNTRAPVLVETVKRWCAEPDTTVIIRPVIDTRADVGVDRYEIPDRIAEQVVLRDETCVFPNCARDARSCDLDHIEPYRLPGSRSLPEDDLQTRPSNLAPLCREHHNLKTARRWAYRRLPDGSYEWTSQETGSSYRTDVYGTTRLE